MPYKTLGLLAELGKPLIWLLWLCNRPPKLNDRKQQLPIASVGQKFRKGTGWGSSTAGLEPSEGSFSPRLHLGWEDSEMRSPAWALPRGLTVWMGSLRGLGHLTWWLSAELSSVRFLTSCWEYFVFKFNTTPV